MGPRMMVNYPAEFVVLVCFILVGEIVAGLSLNLYIMIKWYTDKARIGGKTKTNGNNFIITLKFIDLIICATAIPSAFAVLIIDSTHNLTVCFIKEGLVMFASSGSSFCVLLISVDRYIAVVMPTKQILTPFRITVCRFCAPVVALIGLALPSLSLLMGLYESAKIESLDILPCRHVVWVFKPYYLYEIYYIISFFIAVITTFLCYRSVIKVVRRRLLLRAASTSASTTASENNQNIDKFRKPEFKATRVAFAVVLSFLVCWGPHVVLTIVQFTLPDNLIIDMIQSVCLGIAFLTPVIHPVIYTYETSDSRHTFTSSSIPLCGSLIKGNSRVTPEQTNIESVATVNQMTMITFQREHSNSTGNSNVVTMSEHTV